MFLSKKNAIYFNKPKNIDPKKPKRVLAGWQDDLSEKEQTYHYESKSQHNDITNNLLIGDDFVDLSSEKTSKKDNKQKFYQNWDQLDERDDIQCEKKLLQQIIQPGGIRIKPNDNMLNEFVKETKGMEVHIIGSLLLSKLEVNYPFQTKAKALYTIEFLIKKNDKYLSYFKAHVDKIKEFPQPEDNVDNYRKIVKTVLNFIGIANPAQSQEEQKPVFVDPGYNDDPKSKISNFIQQNANKTKKIEPKRIIIGPGQSKPHQGMKQQKSQTFTMNNDFLNLDLLGNNNTSPNLLQSNQSNVANQVNYQQMMGNIPMNNLSVKNTNNNNINLLF